MKILFLFCDMLRPDKLVFGSPVLELMGKIGGTWFREAYTPAAETPRALACMYTGLYPKRNGCRKRGQWPYYFMDTGCDNLFRLLKRHDYRTLYYASPYSFSPREGIVPRDFDSCGEAFFDYDEITEAVEKDSSKNLCVWLGYDDYHDAVDHYSCGPVVSREIADKVGQEHLASAIDKFIRSVGNKFDRIILFSDHGCLLENDKNSEYIGKTRTNITLFVHRAGDKGINEIKNTVSLMDIFPTVAEWLGEKPDTDGISLEDLNTGRIVAMEDIYHYKGVDQFLYSTYNLWAVKTDDYYYIEHLDGKNNGDQAHPADSFRSILEEKCCFYKENRYGWDIINLKERSVGNELIFKVDKPFGEKYNNSGRRIKYTDGSGFNKTASMKISRKLGDIRYQLQRISSVLGKELKELRNLF